MKTANLLKSTLLVTAILMLGSCQYNYNRGAMLTAAGTVGDPVEQFKVTKNPGVIYTGNPATDVKTPR